MTEPRDEFLATEALLPPLPPDTSLDPEYIREQIATALLASWVEADQISAGTETEAEEKFKLWAEATTTALLSLRGPDGKAKLLWTRAEVFEVFRRQQGIIRREEKP